MHPASTPVACAMLLIGSSGCACSCGNCGFIPALLVAGAVQSAAENVAREPIREDLGVVLKGEPERTAAGWSRYRDAAARLEGYGRGANEVIDQEHWRSWRKPRVLADRDYATVLRLTGGRDPDWSLSVAEAIRRSIDRKLASPGPADDGDPRLSSGTGRRYPVPEVVKPQLLARREELDQLIAELKPRIARDKDTAR